MKNPFLIEYEQGKYHLHWDDGDGFPGLCVGDPNKKLPKKVDPHEDRDLWEIKVVRDGVALLKPLSDSAGFYWEDEKAAKAAMSLAKMALKMPVAMPDWAAKASAAGWKPPKGWKP